jgi:hypothetical protein
MNDEGKTVYEYNSNFGFNMMVIAQDGFLRQRVWGLDGRVNPELANLSVGSTRSDTITIP